MYGLEEGEEYKPWLWRPPEGGVIGVKGQRRQDGYDKASGKGQYTRDVYLPGMLYAKVLLSPHPHARITSMDTSQAEALPGVRAVLRYDDPNIDWPMGMQSTIHSWSLVGDYAFYYPQPVGALVVADTELLCDEALKLIEINWEELPFILDWNEALEPGAYVLHPDLNPDNNLRVEREQEQGDVEAGLAEADNVIDVEFNVEPDTWAGVEGGCCVADWKGNNVELWMHTQQWSPYSGQPSAVEDNVLAAVPSLTGMNQLVARAHVGYNGAEFGALVNWDRDIAIYAVIATKAVKRPVKFLYDGSHFLGMGEHLGTYKMTIGFKDNGEITAVKYHTIMCSAFDDQINKIQKGSKIENLGITMTHPYTNLGSYQCYKHGDAPCSCHAEPFDQVAAALGMDPTKVAMINDGCYGHDWDYVRENVIIPEGKEDRHSLTECLEIGKAAIDWDNKWHQPGTKILPNGNYHGLGFIWHICWSNGSGGGQNFGVRMLSDGTVTLLGASADTGQCRDAAYCQIVASELGVKFEDIFMSGHVYSGFETQAPGGSGGLVANSPSIVRASKKLKQVILESAGLPRPGGFMAPGKPPLFEGKTADELDIKDSMVFEKADPSNAFPISELSSAFHRSFFAWDVAPRPVIEKSYTLCRQCYFMEVEVDPDTGGVDVKKMVHVYDFGQVISPESCEGQQFSCYMGLGRSLQEQIIWDPQTGVKLTDNLIGYDIAVMNDCGPIEAYQVETHHGYSAYGAYGCGESPGACVCSMTRYAVHNAIGKWVDLKTTPDKILKALGRA